MGVLMPGGILRCSAEEWDRTNKGLTWWCPGCNQGHMIRTGEGPGPRWGWNGSAEKPTFTPSVMVTYNGSDAGRDGAPPAVCHSFVVDGAMQFLGDCTHALAGQTVPIPPMPRRESDG